MAFLNLDHIALLETVLTAGFFGAYLYQSALGGWLSSITSGEEEKIVSVWMTIANVGGFGAMAIGCNQLTRHLSPVAVALVLGTSILMPMIAFPFMQAPGPDRSLASESFPQFFGDLISLVKRREVLVAIILFAAPASTFSLTNFLGGRGSDFHASPGFIGLVGGIGAAAGGIVGCLVFPALSRRIGFGPAIIAAAVVSAASALLIPAAGGPKLIAIGMMVASQLLGDSFGVAMLIGIKSLQQSVFAPHLLGRVGATMRAAAGGAAIVGAVAGGLLAGPFGIRATLLVGASGILAATLLIVASPLLRLREPPLAAA